LFEDFETDLLNTLGTQVDILETRKKQEEQDQVLSTFCPKCRKKHPLRECPLDNIHVCGLCTKNDAIDDCQKLKEFHANQMEESQGMEYLYYLAPRRPWKPRFIGMSQNSPQQFPQNYQYPIQNLWMLLCLGRLGLLNKLKINLLNVGKTMLMDPKLLNNIILNHISAILQQ